MREEGCGYPRDTVFSSENFNLDSFALLQR